MNKRLLILLTFLFYSFHLFAQEITITGKVVASDDKEELPGVSVFVKGSTTGTITDVNGNYSISVPTNSETLVFSFVGYKRLRHL